jgi:SulP family sulfate permease
MSSPLGFTPWRRRALSSTSQRDQDQAQLRGGEPSSPPHPHHGHSAHLPIATPRPSSINSVPGHREPIRSFIHGSVRDSLGKCAKAPENLVRS